MRRCWASKQRVAGPYPGAIEILLSACDQCAKGVQLMVTVGDQPAQLAADWVLTTTRSVRKGLDTTREVPRELIEDCLRVAMQAPMGSNVLYPHTCCIPTSWW